MYGPVDILLILNASINEFEFEFESEFDFLLQHT